MIHCGMGKGVLRWKTGKIFFVRDFNAVVGSEKRRWSFGDILEARVGIEPTHKGFADLSLTTWVPRLSLLRVERGVGSCKALGCFGSGSD